MLADSTSILTYSRYRAGHLRVLVSLFCKELYFRLLISYWIWSSPPCPLLQKKLSIWSSVLQKEYRSLAATTLTEPAAFPGSSVGSVRVGLGRGLRSDLFWGLEEHLFWLMFDPGLVQVLGESVCCLWEIGCAVCMDCGSTPTPFTDFLFCFLLLLLLSLFVTFYFFSFSCINAC